MRPAGDRYDFAISPRLRVSEARIGTSGEPLLMIDELLAAPESLVDYAAQAVAFAPSGSPQGGFPGVRAPAPLNYVNDVVRALAPVIANTWNLGDAGPGRAECFLSIVTRDPDALAPLQRIPHIDTVDPMQFAMLHYLCPAEHGGTAFYRHRATGLETIPAEREAEYLAARDGELSAEAPPPGYLSGSSAHYEQIAEVDARFNRLVVYRSRLLHSGSVPPGRELSADPRRGRLTANVFVTFGRRRPPRYS